jgi:hypothetical protein
MIHRCLLMLVNLIDPIGGGASADASADSVALNSRCGCPFGLLGAAGKNENNNKLDFFREITRV